MADFIFSMGYNVDNSEIERTKKDIAGLGAAIEKIDDQNIKIKFDDNLKLTEKQVHDFEQNLRKVLLVTDDLDDAMDKAFRMTGIDPLTRDIKELRDQTSSLDKEMRKVAQSAKDAEREIRDISRAAKLATVSLKDTESAFDTLKNNMVQGVGQTIAFGGITAAVGAFSSAVYETMKLDKVMTDIQIVTSSTAGEMEVMADAAFRAAGALGATGQEYLEASLIFQQQGGLAARYSDQLAESTVIASNVTGQSMEEMSDQITAVVNGFGLLESMGGDAGMYIVDVMSKLGAVSGSSMDEMAEALQRTATVAQAAGFDLEQISAGIATVSEVTRRSPEVIGTAFKSILLSFQQLREGSEEEINMFTSKVEEAFRLGGVSDKLSIWDDEGRLKDAQVILEEIGAEWQNISKEGKAVIAEAIAGKEQAEVLQVFLENQDRYNTLVEDAYGSAGTAMEQQLIYMDSLEGKLGALKNEWGEMIHNIVDSDFMKGLVDGATNFLAKINDMESAFMQVVSVIGPLLGLGAVLSSNKVGDILAQKSFEKSQGQREELIAQMRGAEAEQAKKQLEVEKQILAIRDSLGEKGEQLYRQTLQEGQILDAKQISLQEEILFKGKVLELSNQLEAASMSELEILSKMESEYTATSNKQREILLLKQQATKLLQNERMAVGDVEAQEQGRKTTLEKVSALLGEQIFDLAAAEKRLGILVNEENQRLGVNKKLLEIAQRQNGELKRMLSTSEHITNEELEQLKVKQQQIAAEQKLNQQTQQGLTGAGQAGAKGGKIMAGAGAALAGVSMFLPTLEALGDATMTAEEKVNGLGNAMLTFGSLIPHPAAQVAVMAAGLVLSFVKIEEQMEVVRKKNEELMKTFISFRDEALNNISAVRGLKDAFEDLAGAQQAGGTAEDILGASTDPEEVGEKVAASNKKMQESYASVAEVVAQTNPELVKYYDSQGRAVIDLSVGYDGLIKKQQESLAQSNQMMVNNSENFAMVYSSDIRKAMGENQKLTKDIAKTKKDVDEAIQSGASTEKINELNTALAESITHQKENQKVIEDTQASIQASIIQPLYDSNAAVNMLAETGTKEQKEMISNAKEMISNLLSAQSVSDNLSLGHYESVSSVTKGSQAILEMYRLAAEGSGEYYKKAVQDFENMSSIQQHYMVEVAGAANMSAEETTRAWDRAQQEIAKISSGGISELLSDIPEETASKISEIKDRINDVSNETAFWKEQLEQAKEAGDEMGIAIAEGELEATGQHLEGLIEKYERFEPVIDEANERFYDQLGVMAQTTEGYNELVEMINESIDEYKDLEDILEDKGDLDESQIEYLDELIDRYPDLADEIARFKEGTADSSDMEQLMELQEEMAEHSAKMYQQANLDNAEYFSEWTAMNEQMIQANLERYGIDAQNYSTMSEYRLAIAAAEAEGRGTYADYAKTRFINSLTGMTTANADSATAVMNGWRGAIGSVIGIFSVWRNSGLDTSQKILASFLGIGDAIINAIRAGAISLAGGVDKMINGMIEDINGFINVLKRIPVIGDMIGGPVEWRSNIAGKVAGMVGVSNMAGNYVDKTVASNKEYLDSLGGDEQLPAPKPMAPKPPSPPGKGPDTSDDDDDKGKPPGTGGGDSGGGGKKPSGGKGDKGGEDVEDMELKIDPYKTFNEVLKDTEDALKRVQKAQKDAIGDDKRELMGEELKLLQQQLAIEEGKFKVQQYDLKQKSERLKNYGFEMDSMGNIINYNERIIALTNEANSKSGDSKKIAQEQVKFIEQQAKEFEKVREEAQKYADEMKELRKEIEETYLEFMTSYKEEADEASKILNDIWDLQDDINDGFEDTALRFENSMKRVGDNIDNVKNSFALMGQIAKDTNLSDESKQNAIKDILEDALDEIGDLNDAWKELQELQVEVLEEGIDLFEEQIDKMKELNDQMQDFGDVLEDVYGTGAYDSILELNQLQLQGIEDQLNGYNQMLAQAKEYQKTLEEGSDSWNEVQKMIDDLNSNKLSLSIEKIEKMKEIADQIFEKTLTDLEEAMFGPGGLDAFEDKFDKITESQEKYVNSLERARSISDITARIQKEIAESNDPKRQEALNKFLQEQVNMLNEKDKLTHTDLERMELMYQLELQRLALSERQEALMVAQLSRDDSGEFSYQYVREPSKKKEEDDETSSILNDLIALDQEALRQNTEEIQRVYKDLLDKISQLDPMAADYEKRLEALRDEALKEMAQLQKEREDLIANVNQSGIAGILEAFDKTDGALSVFDEKTDETIKALLDKIKDGSIEFNDILSKDFDQLAIDTGISAEEIKNAYDAMTDSTLSDWVETNEDLDFSTESLKDAVQEYIDNMTDDKDGYGFYKKEILAAIKAHQEALGDLDKDLDKNQENLGQTIDKVKDTTTEVGKLNDKVGGPNGLKAQLDKVNSTIGSSGDKNSFLGKLEAIAQDAKRKDNGLIQTGKNADEAKKKMSEAKTEAGKTADGIERMSTDAKNAINAMWSNSKKSLQSTIDKIGDVGGAASSAASKVGTAAGKISSAVGGMLSDINKLNNTRINPPEPNMNKVFRVIYEPVLKQTLIHTNGGTKAMFGGDQRGKFPIGAYVPFERGGYTGDKGRTSGVDGIGGVPAILHPREFVMNADMTKKMADAVGIVRGYADMLRKHNQTPGQASAVAPALGSNPVTQDIHIKAEFPNATNRSEIEGAFENLSNLAMQWAHKTKSY